MSTLRPPLTLVALLLITSCAAPAPPPEVIRLASDEAAHLADSIRAATPIDLADGLAATLWASDVLAPDPIGLFMDRQGRAHITRTHRQKNSEFDIRGFREWMTASIRLQTVEDRRAFLHETFATERSDSNTWLRDLNRDSLHDWRDLAVETEQVFRVEDTDGDGLADASLLMVNDFHDEVTDVAGTILGYDGSYYLGVGPDLWRLFDDNGDGAIDRKESLSHGYAVHIGFSGHGMSGLIVGPDGRVYWSIGDIGSNVVDATGRRWAHPNEGAIFRAEPDGSGFEVFAAGVRNTHEFVFDAYGNLISVDNDGDHPGEQERLVYLVEGSDSGWRINWQFGKYTDPDNNGYKVWMDERLFKPRFEGQAAHITPPIANYHSGPAGMVYSPGTALSDAWDGQFFVAEFTGSPARSRIFAFRLKPDGAGFAFDGETVVARGILTTGLDFGPDGALYAADWLDGWGTKDRGRIWKLDVTDGADVDLRAETQALLGEDLDQRSDDALAALLRHADMRVRQAAQFALVRHDAEGTLLQAAQQTDHQLARIHALWGLGQLIRAGEADGSALRPFLDDDDPEVRAQAAKGLGDVRYAPAAEALIPLMADAAPRVRFFAAEALGRLAYRPARAALIDMLADNDGRDVYLRHAGALALARLGEAEPLAALAAHPSDAVRTAAVVALRRLHDPGVARFLNDHNPYIATDAARAINDDLAIEDALPDLAATLATTPLTTEPYLRRALNANFRLGGVDEAEAVATYAARTDAPEAMRVEAVAMLGTWPNPSVLDRVDGRYRGAAPRDTTVARQAFAPIADALLADGSAGVRAAAAETVGRLAHAEAYPTLLALLQQDPDATVRTAALQGLERGRYDALDDALALALNDRDATVRTAALALTPTLPVGDDRIAELLGSVLGQRSIAEQQTALQTLAPLQGPQATAVLAAQLDRLIEGTLPPELHLDLSEALQAHGEATLTDRLTQHQSAQASDPLATYRDALYGGDARRGRRLYIQHEAAQCTRCHAIRQFGGDVGPPLDGIAARLTPEELLTALVDPGARIAPGYGTITLTLTDGTTATGILREETDTQFVLQTDIAEPLRIPKQRVSSRRDAPSAMPPMDLLLTKRELRDLVAFLMQLDGTQ